MGLSLIKRFFYSVYFLVGVVFLTLSLNRQSFFLEHVENFSLIQLRIVIAGFAFLFAAYFLVFFENKFASIKKLIWMLIPLVFLYLVIPPFLTRDAASYMIIARNFLWLRQNPYLNPIGNPQNLWVRELGQVWWLSYPSPYGPIFLLLTLLAVLPNLSSLVTTIYLYKLIVAAGYFLSIFIISRLSERSKKDKIAFLYAFNPALLVHVFIEGHNEIFIILALLALLYLFKERRTKGSYLAFLASVFLKFNTIIFLPLFWFIDKKFSWRRFFVANIIFVLTFFLFLWLFNWNFKDFWNNLFFVSSKIIYSASPFVLLNVLSFGSLSKLSLKLFFLLAYFFVFYRFLIKEKDILKFIFWSFIAFGFIGITWLTPWYLALIIPVGLLIEGGIYQAMTLFLTFYSLFHVFGI